MTAENKEGGDSVAGSGQSIFYYLEHPDEWLKLSAETRDGLYERASVILSEANRDLQNPPGEPDA